MTWLAKTHVLSITLFLLFEGGLGPAQISTQQPLQASRSAAPQQHVMAPPPELRAVLKNRPSTAEAGLSRSAKAPLRFLPALHVAPGRSSQIPPQSQHHGHWLLLYRTDHCISCDRLMNVLAASASADLRNGIPYAIIVGGASASAIADVRARYSTLAEASWTADPDRSTFNLLQLRGAPELFAMDDNRIAWKISGNLGNPQQVLQLADSWIAGSAATDAAANERLATPAKTNASTARR